MYIANFETSFLSFHSDHISCLQILINLWITSLYDVVILQDDDLGDLDDEEGKEQPSTTGSLGKSL